MKRDVICGLAMALALWPAALVGNAGEAAKAEAPKAEVSKNAETPEGIELSPQSARFIEIAAVGKQTNELWGRRIPARVSLQTSARVNVGAVVEGRVDQVLVR